MPSEHYPFILLLRTKAQFGQKKNGQAKEKRPQNNIIATNFVTEKLKMIILVIERFDQKPTP